MKRSIYAVAMFLFLFVFAVPVKNVCAEVKVGISVGDAGLDNFYLALSNYNNVPEANVVAIRNNGITDEQVPVVMFLASRAHVAPDVIVKMRQKRMTWFAIATKFKIGADAFYVPANESYAGTVYEKPYKFYGQDRRKWNKIRLSDEDVVNFVNLKFVSEYHGYTTDQVIKMRASGKNFINIHSDIRNEVDAKAKRDNKWYQFKKKAEVKHGHDAYNEGSRDDGRGNDNGNKNDNRGKADKRNDKNHK